MRFVRRTVSMINAKGLYVEYFAGKRTTLALRIFASRIDGKR